MCDEDGAGRGKVNDEEVNGSGPSHFHFFALACLRLEDCPRKYHIQE